MKHGHCGSKKIKTKQSLLIVRQEALKAQETQSASNRFKARLENAQEITIFEETRLWRGHKVD